MLKMKNKIAPVVLFVYNRPKHTYQTLENLSKAVWAKETHLFIYSDAPRDKEESGNVNKVREIIKEYEKENSKFLSVDVCYAEKNQGLATSIIHG